jgi:hypothetical protein
MKVMYQGGSAVSDGWLQAGLEYIALFIQTSIGGRQQYLLWSDIQSCVAFFPIAKFTIIDHKIPTNWVVSTDLNDCLIIGPKSWLEDDFWDRYHNGDHDAEEAFMKALSEMM